MKVILDIEESHSPFFLELIKSLPYISIVKEERSSKTKLSERFAGKLNLSDEEYNKFQQYLKDSRNEWERTI
jgi:phosphoglycerol transferase MdoB-like AlkP superfamily enzyme